MNRRSSRNTHAGDPRNAPKGYHLTEDIADDAIDWLREQKA